MDLMNVNARVNNISYNITTDNRHINTIVKRMRNTVVLMVNTYIDIKDEVEDITIVINSGMIDYCFADFFSLYRI